MFLSPLLLSRRLAALAAAASLLTLAQPGECAAETVWRLTPYRVGLIVAMQRAAGLTPRLEDDLSADLVGRIDATIGAAWDLSVLSARSPLRHRLLEDIQTVPIESLPGGWEKFDKVILLAVAGRPSSMKIAAREFDVRTRTFGTAVHLPVWQSAKLRDTALAAVVEAFAPLARIESVSHKEKSATLRLRAVGLAPRDGDWTMVRPGDVFRTVVRYNDREGNPRRITAIPWTFLTVEEVTSDRVHCRLYTGLRSPLSGRRRGRVEQLALALAPPRKATRLTLLSRTEPREPLPGYEVFVRPAGAKKAIAMGHTDWRGRVLVPPTDDPVRELLIRSGGQLLARLPMVPGALVDQTALIAKDDRRLEAEGFVIGLQENLVDLVARRQVLIARTKARIKAGQLDEARSMLRQLRALDSADRIAQQLDKGKNRIISSDRAIQIKIDKLFSSTGKLLAKHLRLDPIEGLAHEISQAGAPEAGNPTSPTDTAQE